MKTLKKYDRAKLRTPQEVEQKYNLEEIENNANEVEKMRKELDTNVKNVNDSLANMNKSLGDKANKEDVTNSFNEVNKSIDDMNTSLEDKVDKETGKGLSSNDFTTSYKQAVDENTKNNHTHSNKSVLDGIDSYDIENWDYASQTQYFDLSDYAVSGLSILRSSCELKNNRVCINFVGTLSMNANTTTTLFEFPSGLCPVATRDFVVFGQSSNNTGYVGYGYVTSDGLFQVRFSNSITSYIRFSFTYDIY
jgi:hypothetical protein